MLKRMVLSDECEPVPVCQQLWDFRPCQDGATQWGQRQLSVNFASAGSEASPVLQQFERGLLVPCLRDEAFQDLALVINLTP